MCPIIPPGWLVHLKAEAQVLEGLLMWTHLLGWTSKFSLLILVRALVHRLGEFIDCWVIDFFSYEWLCIMPRSKKTVDSRCQTRYLSLRKLRANAVRYENNKNDLTGGLSQVCYWLWATKHEKERKKGKKRIAVSDHAPSAKKHTRCAKKLHRFRWVQNYSAETFFAPHVKLWRVGASWEQCLRLFFYSAVEDRVFLAEYSAGH